MNKNIYLIAVFCLMVMSCHHSKQESAYTDPKEKEAMEKWAELEDSFNNASISDKDELLMEMLRLKMQWNYKRYLEPLYDSLIWSFFQDERTFYLEYKKKAVLCRCSLRSFSEI